MPSGWPISRPTRATARPHASKTPTSSSSTPATSANGRRRRSIPNSASCASSRTNAARRGGGRRSSSRAASPRRRARKSCAASRRSTSSSVRKAIIACPSFCARRELGAGVVDTDFPAEDKFAHLPASRPRRSAGAASPPSSPSRRAATSSARSASCPTPAAPRSRARSARSSTRSRASRRPGVREVTLIGQNVNAYHGLDGDGRAVGLADLIRAVAAVPGIARVRYATSHPERHERRPDRRPSRCPGARALSASAGPIRLGPDPEVDEPPPSRRRLSRHRRPRARGAAGHRPLVRLHRRLSGRNRRRFRGDARARPRRRLRLVLRLQIFGPARNARRRDAPDRSTRRPRSGGSPRFRRCSRSSGRPSTARPSGGASRFCSRSPAGTRARSIGRSPYMQAVFADGAESLIGAMAEVEIVGVEPHSLRGRVVSPAS